MAIRMESKLLTDQQLRERTEELLSAAETVSLELRHQTERLAAAIDLFDSEVLKPLREKVLDQ